MGVVGKLLLIAGLGLTIWAGFESMLLFYGTQQPREVTLAELGKKDPIKNVHVTIRDFQPTDGWVIEERDGRWTRVWVPLYTPDGKWTERPVVLHVGGVQNEQELAAKIGHEKLTGVITNGVQNLGSAQQKQFAPTYPGVDLSDAIAFGAGRKFPSALLTIPLLALGTALLLGGGYLTFRR